MVRFIAIAIFSLGTLHAADAISVTLDKNALTVTATLDATALKAEYAKKKAETGKSDAELRGYRETLILDAVMEAIRKARAAAEQTDAERAAELIAQKARLDAEYAKRAELKPVITVNP